MYYSVSFPAAQAFILCPHLHLGIFFVEFSQVMVILEDRRGSPSLLVLWIGLVCKKFCALNQLVTKPPIIRKIPFFKCLSITARSIMLKAMNKDLCCCSSSTREKEFLNFMPDCISISERQEQRWRHKRRRALEQHCYLSLSSLFPPCSSLSTSLSFPSYFVMKSSHRVLSPSVHRQQGDGGSYVKV